VKIINVKPSVRVVVVSFLITYCNSLYGQKLTTFVQKSDFETLSNFSEKISYLSSNHGRSNHNHFESDHIFNSLLETDNSYYKRMGKSKLSNSLIVTKTEENDNAKFGEINAIYLTTELNAGNYFGGDISLNYIYKEKYSFKIGYTGIIRKPKSLPADYEAGAIGLLFAGFTDPLDYFDSYQIGIGRIYRVDDDERIRLNLSVGLGYTVLKEPENWVKRTQDEFLKENYTWDYNETKTLSLIINPKIEFSFIRVYGLTLSPMLQINTNRTYYGVGIGQMIGLLRKRRS
jgi:hypothetical protein